MSASVVCAMLDRLSMDAPMARTSVPVSPVDSGVVRMVMQTPTTLGGSAAESRSHELPPELGGKRRTWLAASVGLGVAAVARSVKQWNFIWEVSGRIDETELRKAQAAAEAARPYASRMAAVMASAAKMNSSR